MKPRHSGAIISTQGQNNVKAQSGAHSTSGETLSLQDPASKSKWQTCLMPYEMEDLMKRGKRGEMKKQRVKAKQHKLALFSFLMSELGRFQGKDLTAEFHIKAHF